MKTFRRYLGTALILLASGSANAQELVRPHVDVAMQTEAPEPGLQAHSTHISRLLFLNRCAGGCTIGPGYNDAAYNTSAIVDRVSSISAWRHSDTSWNALVNCMREIYAPYDLEITDVDPGANASHNEAIVAGEPQEIGLEGGFGGIAPSRCLPYNNAISFTFANVYGDNPIAICHTVAQETAHAYGLEHSLNCSDPMTYLPTCGRQFFRDESAACGEYEALETCRCGGSAQNTHRSLLDALGPNLTPVPGPGISVESPIAGEAVGDAFPVIVSAYHMRGVTSVRLFLNGEPYGEQVGHPPGSASSPYQFEVPSDLPDGIIDVEIRATIDIGSESSSTVTVQKGEPCASEATCYEGQQCTDGRCQYPEANGDLGDRCTADRECLSNLCSIGSEDGYCSKPCFPTPTENTCPEDFKCVEVGPNRGHCRPTAGCGCQSGSGSSSGGLLLLLAVAFALRRKCRSSTIQS